MYTYRIMEGRIIMLKKLQTPNDISILFDLDDDAGTQFPCDRSTWIQWLTEQAANPKIGIWAAIKNENVIGYLVMMDSVIPPLFDAAVVLYLWSPGSHKITRSLIEEAKNWTRIINAKRGLITVPENHDKKYMESFGGRKIANVFEWRSE